MESHVLVFGLYGDGRDWQMVSFRNPFDEVVIYSEEAIAAAPQATITGTAQADLMATPMGNKVVSGLASGVLQQLVSSDEVGFRPLDIHPKTQTLQAMIPRKEVDIFDDERSEAGGIFDGIYLQPVHSSDKLRCCPYSVFRARGGHLNACYFRRTVWDALIEAGCTTGLLVRESKAGLGVKGVGNVGDQRGRKCIQ